jgi:hypothetical protein
MNEDLTNAARELFYERVFDAAVHIFSIFLRSDFANRHRVLMFESELEDEAYKRCAREAVRAAEFLVLELHQAQTRSDPGEADPRDYAPQPRGSR